MLRSQGSGKLASTGPAHEPGLAQDSNMQGRGTLCPDLAQQQRWGALASCPAVSRDCAAQRTVDSVIITSTKQSDTCWG